MKWLALAALAIIAGFFFATNNKEMGASLLLVFMSVFVWEYVVRSETKNTWLSAASDILERTSAEFAQKAAPSVLLSDERVLSALTEDPATRDRVLRVVLGHEMSVADTEMVVQSLLPRLYSETEWWRNHELTITIEESKEKEVRDAQLWDVVYDVSYTTVLDSMDLTFVCVDSLKEQRRLFAQGYDFVLMRGKRLPSEVSGLVVESASIGRQPLKEQPSRKNDPAGMSRWARKMSAAQKGKRHEVKYKVRSRLRKDRSMYYVVLPHTALGVRVNFGFDSLTGITRLSTRAFMSGAKNTSVDPELWLSSVEPTPAKLSKVRVPLDELVLPGSGIVYVWDVEEAD